MDDQLKRTSGIDGDDRTLEAPHFDDEATLLSARPVVPFHELAEKNPKRRLYFGAGLVVALLIGLFGGILYAHLNETPGLRSETPPATTAAQDQLVSTTDAPAESDADSAESTEEVNPPVKTTTGTAHKNVPEIPRPRRNSARIIEKSASRPARKPRTEGPRRASASDDLFRIQEIFEGSSRP